jgi:hypothetical protein
VLRGGAVNRPAGHAYPSGWVLSTGGLPVQPVPVGAHGEHPSMTISGLPSCWRRATTHDGTPTTTSCGRRSSPAVRGQDRRLQWQWSTARKLQLQGAAAVVERPWQDSHLVLDHIDEGNNPPLTMPSVLHREGRWVARRQQALSSSRSSRSSSSHSSSAPSRYSSYSTSSPCLLASVKYETKERPCRRTGDSVILRDLRAPYPPRVRLQLTKPKRGAKA